MKCPCKDCICMAVCKAKTISEIILQCELLCEFLKAEFETGKIRNPILDPGPSIRMKFDAKRYDKFLDVLLRRV